VIRWPDRIPAGRVSNEIVHEVDTYTTFAKLAGAQVPQDRPIDGVDQTDFLLGKSHKSNREGFPVFVADRLEAVKWKNWKVVFYDEQRDWWTPPTKLGSPKAFDLITDPKEEYPQTGLRSSWIAGPAMQVMVEFEQSLKHYPPIAPGTPDPYTPPKSCSSDRLHLTRNRAGTEARDEHSTSWHCRHNESDTDHSMPDHPVCGRSS